MKRSAIQLHVVPKYISSLDIGLPSIAKSVTLLEIADVWNEGLSFLWVFAWFFSFFLKNHKKYLAISQGLCFRNCTDNTHTEICFPVLNLYWLLETSLKVVCYRSSEAKIPAVPNNLQFDAGLKIPISCLSSGQWNIRLSIIKQTAYESLLSISGKYDSLAS